MRDSGFEELHVGIIGHGYDDEEASPEQHPYLLARCMQLQRIRVASLSGISISSIFQLVLQRELQSTHFFSLSQITLYRVYCLNKWSIVIAVFYMVFCVYASLGIQRESFCSGLYCIIRSPRILVLYYGEESTNAFSSLGYCHGTCIHPFRANVSLIAR